MLSRMPLSSTMIPKPSSAQSPSRLPRLMFLMCAMILFGVGLAFRTAGLFHGLDKQLVFHPDSPKQVAVLGRYLDDRHVEYHDTLFHDGYPFGLNRVDEFLIEAVYAGLRPLHDWFTSGNVTLEYPDRHTLYYITRLLRVLYGMVALSLTVLSVHILTRSRGAVLVVLSLFATSALSAVVTHSATGDVGVDLFTSLVVMAMVLGHMKGSAGWTALAGLAVGMSFACKYQGALLAWIVAVPIVCSALQRPKGLGYFLKNGFAAGLACLAGVVLLTPGFLVNSNRTWKNMRANFEFIKNYNVSQEFLDKSFPEKLTHGLLHNVPFVFNAIGYGLMLMLVMALVVMIRDWRSTSTRKLPGTHMWLAVITFPFLALFLSVSLKPAVQPFHFSYLLVPITLSAGYLYHRAKRTGRLSLTWLCTGLVFLSLYMEVGRSLHEVFFWQGNSMQAIARTVARDSFVTPRNVRDRNADPRYILRTYDAEPENLSVFRNRPQYVMASDAPWWKSMIRMPLPGIPLPEPFDWVFLEGPVFPRNDRQFYLMGAKTYRFRIKGSADHFRSMTLGFRSGSAPVTFDGTIGGKEIDLTLPPHQQARIELKNLDFQELSKSSGTRSLAELVIQVGPGDGWITFLPSRKERDLFAFFGPNSGRQEAPLEWGAEDPLFEAKASDLQFYESEGAEPIGVAPSLLGGSHLVLPRGGYTFSAWMENRTGADVPVRFEIRDPVGIQEKSLEFRQTLQPGWNEVEWRFAKPFVPYHVLLDASIEHDDSQAKVMCHRWSIRPRYLKQPPSGSTPAHPFSAADRIRFRIEAPKVAALTGFSVRQEGLNVTYTVHAEALTRDPVLFRESVIFLHLRDAEGKILKGLDFRLSEASFSDERINLHLNQLPDLPSGTVLDLYAGIYNARTREKEPVHLRAPPPAPVKEAEDSFRIYSFNIP